MDRTKDLLQRLRQEPEEMEWATAGPRKDKSHENRFANSAAKEVQKPLMLLEQYCTEGKILHGHIDDRCLSYMRNLHPDVQCQALTEYANRRSKDTLNNPPAYFMSLLQSLESAAHRSHVLKKKNVREGVTSNLAAASEKLLQDLQCSGVIGEFELDSACLSNLAKLPSTQQIQVLEQYANIKHRDQLRCNAAFFMGLLKQVADKKQTPSVLVVAKSVPVNPSFVSPDAKQKLAELHSQGILEPALMDQHCMGLLAVLPKTAQLSALIRIAANIGEAENKRGYITHLLKNMRASAISIAGTASKAGLPQQPKAGSTAVGGKVLSNTGKLINPNEVSIRLNPSSIFYDAELAMCWRVLTKQDKFDWQNRLAKGKQMKLINLSQPRQMLAQQLQPGHPQYRAATASAWKFTDAPAKEELLKSADESGEAIQLIPQQSRPPLPPAAAVEPEFHEIDFPPLGGQIETNTIKAAGSGSDIGSSLRPDYTSLQMGLQTDKGKLGIADASAGDEGSQTLPLYNMGMAFQQSLSLQDINKSDRSNPPSTDCLASVSAEMQGLTSRSDALDPFGYGHAHAFQAKPRPANRPALQSVSTSPRSHMPNSLPLASGPFPGITKNLHSHPGFAQVAPYIQQTHQASAVPGSSILAQHAFDLHSSSAHASSYTSSLAQGSMQPQTSLISHRADANNTSGVQGTSHQTNNRALDRVFGSICPSSTGPGSEKLMCGFAPHYVATTQSQPGPGTAPTGANGGKSDNIYVSFDEWRAQVHAKMSLPPDNSAAITGRVGLPYSGHRFDQQPLSWLPSAKGPDLQCGNSDF